MVREFRYPLWSLRGDYIRAGAGAGLSLVPLLMGLEGTVAVSILVLLLAMFGAFGVNTMVRQFRRIKLTDDGIKVSGLAGGEVSWSRVTGLSLAYFSTWRSQNKGWMQLRIEGEGLVVRVESTLDGFDEITRRAAAAARANGIDLGSATLNNFGAMGIEFSEGPAAA